MIEELYAQKFSSGGIRLSRGVNGTLFVEINSNSIKLSSYDDSFCARGRVKKNNSNTDTMFTLRPCDFTHWKIEEGLYKLDEELTKSLSKDSQYDRTLLRVHLSGYKGEVEALRDEINYITWDIIVLHSNISNDSMPLKVLMKCSIRLIDILPHTNRPVILLDNIVLMRLKVTFCQPAPSTIITPSAKSITQPSKKGMYINGWQAWSYTGTVLQGEPRPSFGMPETFVKGFHDGSLSLKINQSRTWSQWSSRTTQALFSSSSAIQRLDCEWATMNERLDYLASDMFTILFDKACNQSIFAGFLSQHKQFGCISTGDNYDSISIHIDCDGVILSARPNRCIDTDWLYLTLDPIVPEDPFAQYFALSGRYIRYNIYILVHFYYVILHVYNGFIYFYCLYVDITAYWSGPTATRPYPRTMTPPLMTLVQALSMQMRL